MPDIAIIGAGIAGLAAAWELASRGLRPLVLEGSHRAGGSILTEHLDGFVIDAGPDALLIQKPAAIALCRELGLGDRLFPTLTPRTAFIVRHGRLVPLPEASVLGIPTRIAPFVTTPLFSWAGKARMAIELVLPHRRGDEDESIGSFMRRRFGRETVTWLAEPLLAGIHAGDVERLSMRALFPRLVEAEQKSGSVIRSLRSIDARAAPDGAFLSLPGGIGEMVDALVTQLPVGTIRCGSTVVGIEGPGPFAIRLAAGETIHARAVIMAAPAWVAASVLDSLDCDVAELCRGIPDVSSATIVFGVRRDDVRLSLVGSGFVVPRPERRTLMAASFVSSKWPHRAPEGYVLLRGFLGGAHDPHVLQRTDEEMTRAAWEELATRLDIVGRPVLTRVYRWPRATAQYTVGHQVRVAALDTKLASRPGLFITGSSFRGSGIPDSIADARAVASRAAMFIEMEGREGHEGREG
jgi:oxygen-dependent protoporphyrinogen oxidase